jgi:peptide/nickel transport system substrate-binding protein
MKREVQTIALAVLAVAACSGPRNRPEIVVAIERPPITLDPRFDIDTASENAIELIFNGLTKVNDRMEVEGDLAESFQAIDASHYRFRLRPGVTFQDGSKLTADDVVYTFRYLADPKNGSPFRTSFKFVRSVVATDADTVDVELSEPYAFFPLAARRPILSRALSEKPDANPAKRPLGTGPFRLASFDEHSGLRLEPFAGYFAGAPKAAVRLKPVLDANSRILELLKGSADVVQFTADGFPPGAIEQIRKNPDVILTSTPSVNVQYLNFNMRHPILSKPAVRKAFAHAINREEIIRFKLGGFARAADGLLPPIHWAYEPDVPRYAFDPKLAMKLLDGAGLTDPDGSGPKTRFTVTYRTSMNPQSIEIAEVIRNRLKAVGIGVELRSTEFGTLFDDIKKGNFDVYSMQWTSVLSPDHYYEVFHSKSVPPDGYNRNFYSNPLVDALLTRGRRSASVAEQKKIFGEVQKIVAADLPCLPLWYPDQIAAVRKRVEGYALNSRGTYGSLAGVLLRNP